MQTASVIRSPEIHRPTRKATLLVVDADDVARDGCVAALGRAGYRTVQARTGFEALVKACWHRPDLVIIALPLAAAEGVSGEEMVEMLARCPETSDIPVIALAPECPRDSVGEDVRRRLS